MAKGDIVLINFPFTNLTGNKLRPAVILIDSALDKTLAKGLLGKLSSNEISDIDSKLKILFSLDY